MGVTGFEMSTVRKHESSSIQVHSLRCYALNPSWTENSSEFKYQKTVTTLSQQQNKDRGTGQKLGFKVEKNYIGELLVSL